MTAGNGPSLDPDPVVDNDTWEPSVGDRHLGWCHPSPKLHLIEITSTGRDFVTSRSECGRPVTAPLPVTVWLDAEERPGRMCRDCMSGRRWKP